MNTIEEAKQFLRDNSKKGAECPCCTQFVKVYRRPIHGEMAKALIALLRIAKGSSSEYHHISNFVGGYKGASDFAKLRYWGLIEEKPREESDGDKKSSGYWRITQEGIDFARNECAVKSHAVIFRNRCLRLDGNPVSITSVIKKRFNYSELMGGI